MLIQNNLSRNGNTNIPNGVYINSITEQYFGVNDLNSFISADLSSISIVGGEISKSNVNLSNLNLVEIPSTINKSMVNLFDISNIVDITIQSCIINDISSIYENRNINLKFNIINRLVIQNETDIDIEESMISNINLKVSTSKIFESVIINSTLGDGIDNLAIDFNINNNVILNSYFLSMYDSTTNRVNNTFNLENSLLFNSYFRFDEIVISDNINNLIGFNLDTDVINWALNENLSQDNKMVLKGDLLVDGDIITKEQGKLSSANKGSMFFKKAENFDVNNWETTIEYGEYARVGDVFYFSTVAFNDNNFVSTDYRYETFLRSQFGDIFSIVDLDSNAFVESSLSSNPTIESATSAFYIELGDSVTGDNEDVNGDITIKNTKLNVTDTLPRIPSTFKVASDETLTDGQIFSNGTDVYIDSKNTIINGVHAVEKLNDGDCVVIMQYGIRQGIANDVIIDKTSSIYVLSGWGVLSPVLPLGTNIELFKY